MPRLFISGVLSINIGFRVEDTVTRYELSASLRALMLIFSTYRLGIVGTRRKLPVLRANCRYVQKKNANIPGEL